MSRGLRYTPDEVALMLGRRAGRLPLPGNSAPAAPKTPKYHNQPTERDGHLFPSRWEADCWSLLRLRERAGEIRSLSRQVAFPLMVEGRLIGTYLADFTFKDRANTLHIVDAKSKPTRTPLFRWKAKHLKAEYGFEIELMERPP